MRFPLRMLALGLGIAACEARPEAPVVTLAAPSDTIPTTLGEVTDAVWLTDDRWVVLAPNTETVAAVDFAAESIGPFTADTAALRNPFMLFGLSDTVYVSDWGLRRTTLWSHDGTLVRAVPTTDAVRGALPRARDAAGRFYVELAPPPRRDGSGNRDSAAVLRAAADLASADTVARLSPLDIAEVMGDAGRRFERRVFSGTDAWGALPDGSLWIARVNQNRVNWIRPDGTRVEGEALPDRVLEVTRYDRELFVRRFPPELRLQAQELPFAAIKPPFEAAFTDPAGRVWLQKSRAPADSVQRYHVVDREGRLVREVHLPGPGRILAVGERVALVAERAAGGARLLRVPVTAVQEPAAVVAR